MIFSVFGKLKSIENDSCIINVNGLGYEVYIPENIKKDLPQIGESIELFTYHHIREDNQQLFGFIKIEDKHIFLKLISVSGLGPKLASKILSEYNASELASAIVGKNIHKLTQLPGVGKKMAERLIIELKDKLDFIATPLEESNTTISGAFKDDIISALRALGYSMEEIKQSLKKCASTLASSMTLEQAIKATLKYL